MPQQGLLQKPVGLPLLLDIIQQKPLQVNHSEVLSIGNEEATRAGCAGGFLGSASFYVYLPLVTVDLPPSLRPKTSGKYIS
jgi:hypothetical protein